MQGKDAVGSLDICADAGVPYASEGPDEPAQAPDKGPSDSSNVRLFRSLFRGREDVYARLWQSQRGGKTGYSPACNNEWDPALCDKRKVKCGVCPNRELDALTDTVIERHLKGNHTIGVYPMLPDGTCHFLAVDFDGRSWMEDASAFMETCERTGIPASLERSRSGNGAHVWFFFSEAVPAAPARKLGSHLLTETMSRRHELGMDSYDRLFPNQDLLPKGGFGNLIALPLQKGPSEKGNTLFLDASFTPHEDQWAFLAAVSRVETPLLQEVVRAAERSGQVMGIPVSRIEGEDRPWALPPSREVKYPPLAGPFPEEVRVVLGSRIFVEKKGLPPPLLNRIKRLAAFQNPEFYKKQSLRLSTALIPRVICCSEEFPDYMAIPRGCMQDLVSLFDEAGITPGLTDERVEGERLEAGFRGELTPEQEQAVSLLCDHDIGVLVAPSGSGKTVIGARVIAERGVNTLVLVHRRPLLEQWIAQLSSFLDVDPGALGRISGGGGKRTGKIDVAMFQSLVRERRVKNVIAEYGQVIVDECHHVPAVTFELALGEAKARYVLGLTATPYRRDGHHPIIHMQCGPTRCVIDDSGKGAGSFKRRLICRQTDFTLPSREVEPTIQEIYAALAADRPRTEMIVKDIVQAVGEGRCPIVLTERTEHLNVLVSCLGESLENVIAMHGRLGARKRREAAERLESMPDGEAWVVVATGKYIGEGFDDSRLDTLFLAMPISGKGTIVQYTGRLQRSHPGKKEVRIYDYMDSGVPMLRGMFKKRLVGYRAIGYRQDEC
ncbi:MAG: DEAD/DEAH box helicase [Actinobacteria bacterium]|nr:DEAD/DEAH box helicase [Actinomycetota bacterium]